MNITPAVLAQTTKNTSTQCVRKSHPDFQDEQLVQNFATCTQIIIVFMYETHETGQSRMQLQTTGWPGLNLLDT